MTACVVMSVVVVTFVAVLQVCTNHNETWTSDCEVYQQRCLCLDGSELCRGPQYHHVQIEYYGMCREMPVSVRTDTLHTIYKLIFIE